MQGGTELKLVSFFSCTGSFETAEALLGPHGQVVRRGLCAPFSLQHAVGGSGTNVTVTGMRGGLTEQCRHPGTRYAAL